MITGAPRPVCFHNGGRVCLARQLPPKRRRSMLIFLKRDFRAGLARTSLRLPRPSIQPAPAGPHVRLPGAVMRRWSRHHRRQELTWLLQKMEELNHSRSSESPRGKVIAHCYSRRTKLISLCLCYSSYLRQGQTTPKRVFPS